jgi:type IV pilus biogenesis protein CpaD/CtpE
MSARLNLALVIVLAAGLSGCVYSQQHLSSDFGYALRQAAVAQIANPDAVYTGVPAPGSDGARVAGAQERYRTGKVIEPVGVASTISSGASVGAPNN